MIWEPCFGGEDGHQQPGALFWGLSPGRAGQTASVLAGLESVPWGGTWMYMGLGHCEQHQNQQVLLEAGEQEQKRDQHFLFLIQLSPAGVCVCVCPCALWEV